MRPSLLAPVLLLAACAPDASESTAARAAVSGLAPRAASPAPAAQPSWPDLPDFADPRRFMDLDSLQWPRVEAPRPADMQARLAALGIVPVRGTVGGERTGESVRDYHLVDFSGDGTPDVIYQGPPYAMNDGELGTYEGTRLRMWQVRGGRAVEVLDRPTAMQRIYRAQAGAPLRFRAIQYGCCADPAWTMEYYAPYEGGGAVRYSPHARIGGTVALVWPARFWSAPRRFRVNSAGLTLRSGPEIGAGEEWSGWEGHGNALAEYAAGARGIAIAERADATGRVWWFALMDGRTPPRAAMRDDDPAAPVPLDRLGWISSRFLTEEP
ncbi:MAG TPA: hypothetical protein VF665_23885 [Longimicrobium sp.]|jgi:hypothetical protein|uniref:hypothetical protein n=1 Tax=Longimicrobium sp. TaxID=2029185 RepID=UPI002ED834C4